MTIIAKEILSEYEKRIKEHLYDVTNKYWLIGEELYKARDIIVRESGDKRARGFKKWCEEKLPFTYETAKRYMRAYRERLTDPEEIWYNRQKKGVVNDPENSGNETTTPKKRSARPYYFKIELTTDSREVIAFLTEIRDREDVHITEYEKTDVFSTYPKGICLNCGKETSGGKTGLCKECFIKNVLRKNPDTDSTLSLAERISAQEKSALSFGKGDK